MEDHRPYEEAATIGMKILGAILAVISFRWVAKIFMGADHKFSVTEFGRFVGFWFFLGAGGYMIYTEGNRDHEWTIYSEWYIAIVFGSLLGVLHMDSALDKILKIMEAMINLKRKAPTLNEEPPKPIT